MIDQKDFRRVLGAFATGVTIVTTRAGDKIHGLTANAFCSVSLSPPLVLVCVNKDAQSHDLIVQGKCFAVNILNVDQQHIAERFAQEALSGAARFDTLETRAAVTGAPVLGESLGWVDCKLTASHDGGDHTIFVGEIVALSDGDAKVSPLLYFRGEYRILENSDFPAR